MSLSGGPGLPLLICEHQACKSDAVECRERNEEGERWTVNTGEQEGFVLGCLSAVLQLEQKANACRLCSASGTRAPVRFRGKNLVRRNSYNSFEPQEKTLVRDFILLRRSGDNQPQVTNQYKFRSR